MLMNLKLIQKYSLFFFVSFFISCKSEKKNSYDKPNIIIIYTDDLGYGDVSAYKKGTLNTPNIDKIAKLSRSIFDLRDVKAGGNYTLLFKDSVLNNPYYFHL